MTFKSDKPIVRLTELEEQIANQERLTACERELRRLKRIIDAIGEKLEEVEEKASASKTKMKKRTPEEEEAFWSRLLTK